MSIREFFVLMMVCTLWGLHFTVLRATVEDGGVAPLFYAAMRMSVVALLLLPFLRWHRGQMRLVLIAGLGFGAFNYALQFPAMGMTTASAGAVAVELYMPISILMGVIILGERIRGWSIFGIILAFAGVMIIALSEPGEEAGPLFAIGLIMVCGSAFCEATGAIAVKKMSGISPAQLLAWFAIIGSLVLWPMSLLLETDQMTALDPDQRLNFLGALLYSALLVSIVAHGSYYWLLGRLPIQVIAPTGLMTTVIGVLGGLLILGETLTPGLLTGILITLVGIAIILWRSRKKVTELSSRRPISAIEPDDTGSHENATQNPDIS